MRSYDGRGASRRWLLACLCLLASLVYLGRASGPSNPAPFSTVQGRAVETRATPQAHLVPERNFRAPDEMDGRATADKAEGHRSSPEHRASERLGAAPNAPPAGHPHAAHCPFCFTSAFALEADGAFLVTVGRWRPVRLPAAAVRPSLAVLRHADPRAPPARQG
ncbi:hypothetical protein [Deinococcus aetherius]|uniref:hypothetical protein n=1 Tax=Deinococcus aetherius TaxID=200252 RepID=UPI00222F3DA0|nr:hypothetical protein [Deinococcus aetherius]